MNHLRSQGSPEATDELWSLANGPNPVISLYSGCISNGVRFHTKDLENRRRSQNSGVVVEGDHGGQTHDFYGFLCTVLEMKYMFNHQVVLFQCEWFDTGSSKTICTDAHCTVIDTGSRWYKDDPFVLPNQVKQVFFVNDTKLGGNWKVVQRIERRGIWDIPEIISEEPLNDEMGDVFQQDETTDIPPIVIEDQIGDELCRTDIEAEIIQNEFIHTERRAHDEAFGVDNFICDEDEEIVGMEHNVDEDEFHYQPEGDSESSNDYDVEP